MVIGTDAGRVRRNRLHFDPSPAWVKRFSPIPLTPPTLRIFSTSKPVYQNPRFSTRFPVAPASNRSR
jgi:hypothetical protein